MPSVFVAGSINIKHLDLAFCSRLSAVSERKFTILVGDAMGADAAIQQELNRAGVDDVVVYCSGSEPRNNIGSWRVERVFTLAEPGSRAFFTAKDKKMAEDADYGLMVWDKRSTGTLSNIIELVKSQRPSAVFLHKDRIFVDIKNINDINKLVSEMSAGAREQAEKKIGLSAKLNKIQNEQFQLPV